MSNKVYTIEEIKKSMAPIFDSRDYIDRVYLFGSYAKNNANPDSDIDIVVKLRKNVGMKLYSLYDAIEKQLNKNSDILTENEVMTIMPETYKRDRVLIYER